MEFSISGAAVNQPATEVSDGEILQILQREGRCMTYVIRNWLAMTRPELKTSYVRRRLERLEREGLVQQSTDHPYMRQLGWKLAPAPAGTTGNTPDSTAA